jgi:hypothetical protein
MSKRSRSLSTPATKKARVDITWMYMRIYGTAVKYSHITLLTASREAVEEINTILKPSFPATKSLPFRFRRMVAIVTFSLRTRRPRRVGRFVLRTEALAETIYKCACSGMCMPGPLKSHWDGRPEELAVFFENSIYHEDKFLFQLCSNSFPFMK